MQHKNSIPNSVARHFPILEMDPMGVILVDKQGSIQYGSPTALSHLRYELEEFRKASIFSIHPHMSLLAWKKRWQELGQKAEIVEETEFINRLGVFYPVITKSRLFKAGKNTLCCILVKNVLEGTRYKDVLDMMAEVTMTGSWEYDLVDAKIYLDKGLMSLLGQKPLEKKFGIRGFLRFSQAYLTKAGHRLLFENIQNHVDRGIDFDFEIDIFLSENNWKVFRLIGKTLRIAEQTSKVYGLLQDVSLSTTRKEEMYLSKFTLEHTQENIMWVNKDGSFHYINDRVCSLLNFSRAELSQKSIFDVDMELSDDQWQGNWVKLRESRHQILERVYLSKNQEKIPVSISLNFLEYQEQEFLCMFARDLRYRMLRDKLLKIHSHTLNQSNDIFLWLTEEGNVYYFNQAATEKLGYTTSEMELMDIFQLRKYTPDVYRSLWDKLLEKKFVRREHDVYRKDGSIFPVEAHASFIVYQGEGFACVSWRDVSERKKEDEKLHSAYQEITVLKEKLQQENILLQQEVSREFSFTRIVSTSKAYQKVLRQIAQVAETNATVLIEGETGTGKELLARAVHRLSHRDERSMVKVNCAALPDTLIESELFGHEKGAFTGAYQKKIGRFELADQGSIFLDEIGEIPLDLQPKLLRVLQEGEFERVGGNATIKVDVRVIAATNRDLKKSVETGTFREDLYYRLNVFPIYNIPLRERPEDIVPLIQHFMKKYQKDKNQLVNEIRQQDIDLLLTYSFPGNIRELENIVERAIILSDSKVLNLQSVIYTMRQNQSLQQAATDSFMSFDEMQKSYIIKALKRTRWRISGEKGAAKLLGMNDKTLSSKMRKFNIKREDHLNS